MNKIIDQKPLEDLYDKVPSKDNTKQWNNGVPILISKEEELRIRKASMKHAEFVKGIIAKNKAGVELTPEEAWYYKLEM